LTLHQQALLWDLDGTILDTKVCHFNSWRYALNKYGLDLTQQKFDASFGRNNHASLSIYLEHKVDKAFEDEIVKIKEDYFRETAPRESELVPGVISWFEDAKEMGLPQAIASSAPMENITVLLSSFELTSYFDQIISGEHMPAKPHPDVFLEAAKSLNQSPTRCCAIEDSAHGVQAAKSAQMRCVAVTTSVSSDQLSLADLVLEDFTLPLGDALRRITSK